MSDTDKATIGDRELALLRWIAERGGSTVGEAAEGFGEAHGLARSTVLTMMERLRRKGLLDRRQVESIYRYGSPATSGEVMRGVVESFVERTLGGSLSPFTAYLAQSEEVSDEELDELEALVAKLRGRRGEDGDGEDGDVENDGGEDDGGEDGR